jgi:hypothetical protein
MWPTYTNIGSDDRNQFDYFRSMPGGLAGVKNATAQLEARGVRVLWPYNPWDTGTRREPLSDEDTFAKLLKETGGDGFNGDTMGFVQKVREKRKSGGKRISIAYVVVCVCGTGTHTYIIY